MENNFTLYRKLIADNLTDQVLEKMITGYPNNDSLYLIRAEHKDLDEKRREGTITYKEYQLNMRRINRNILDIIKELENNAQVKKHENSFTDFNQKYIQKIELSSSTIRKIKIIIIVMSILMYCNIYSVNTWQFKFEKSSKIELLQKEIFHFNEKYAYATPIKKPKGQVSTESSEDIDMLS